MIDFSNVFGIMDQNNGGLLDFSEFVLDTLFLNKVLRENEYSLMFDM